MKSFITNLILVIAFFFVTNASAKSLNPPCTIGTPITITPNGPTTFCQGGSVDLDAGVWTSFAWSNGATDEIITVSTAATFTVTVTDGGGCTGTASQDVFVNANPTPSISANGPTTFCQGGSVNLDAGSYADIFWSSGQFTQSILVNTGGTYTVTVDDVNGCTGTASQVVTVNASPTVVIVPSGPPTFCEGGSVTLDAGTFVNYHWNNSASDQSITVSTSFNYRVTVTDANGCTGFGNRIVTVNANPTPLILAGSDTTFCQGDSVKLDAGNLNLHSNAPYVIWDWNSGESVENITVYTAGIYKVIVTDAKGCTGSTSVHVTVNPNPTPVILADGPTTSCSGGTVKLDAGVYSSYSWSTGNISEFLTVAGPLTYTVTVVDANGCTGTASQYVNLTGGLLPVISGNTSFCSNAGGTTLDAGTYTGYEWSTGATTESIFAANGTYTVTVSNGSSCTGSASITIIKNPSPSPTITAGGPTSFCDGGFVTLDAGSFSSYLWSDSDATQTTNASTAGTYTVTVTDAVGCTGTAAQAVSIFVGPTPTITPNGPTDFCTGGSVTLDAGSYVSYNWNTTEVTQTIVASTTGTYKVTVTDANGCTGGASINVSQNSSPTPSITPNGSTTFCSNNSLILDAGVYSSYLWSNGNTTETNSVSTTNTFSVTVTDANGCTGIALISTTANSAPTPTITPSGATSFCGVGSVTLDAGSFSDYLWSTTEVAQTIVANSTGTYSVTVTDINGCTGSNSQVVTSNSNPVPSITPNGTTTFCNGGSVTLDAGVYSSYLWSDASINETLFTNISNTYFVTVTDINGCTGVASISTTVNPLPTPTITPSGPTLFCQGGSVTLDAGSYISYIWTNAAINQSIIVNTSGTYLVTVTDINGCTGVASQTVTVNSNPIPSITPNGATDFCTGGSVTLDAGTFASYNWSTTEVTQTIISSSTGTYTVTVTDANGCIGSASQDVNVNANITPTLSLNGPSAFCQGSSVTIDAGPYLSYLWSTAETTQTINVTSGATYTVTVTLYLGCTGSASQLITINNLPTPTITPNGSTAICNGGSVILDAGIFSSYLWSNASTTSSIVASTSNTYIVTVTDGNGCIGTTSISVSINSSPSPSIIASGPTSFCNGGSVTLHAGAYTSYLWTTAATTESVNAVINGTYAVTVTDGNGCTGTASQFVTVNSNPTPSITPNGAATFCNGGSVNLDAGVYSSYIWSTTETTQVISAASGGIITVTVTDINGCNGNTSILVTVNSNPTPSITPSGATTFCNGGSVDLDAGAFSSYNWSIGSTIQTITAISTGTFVVTVSDGNGCTGTSSIVVVANPLPNVHITPSGPTNFCTGGSVSLDAGTYSSYLWSTTETIQAITVNSSGTYVVTVSDINGCTASASQGVTVSLNVSFNITPSGPTTFCNGGSVNLDAGVYNAYLWSNAQTSEIIHVTASGTYTVTISGANGCSGSSSISVSVNPSPSPTISASGPTSFCNGGSVILDAGTFNSYLWNGGNTTQDLTANATGTYTVSVTDGNGCIGSTSTLVTAYTLPTPTINPSGPTTFCSGSSITLTANAYPSYVWNTTATTSSVLATSTGNYIVTVTDVHSCTGTASQLVTVNPVPDPTILPGGPTSFCAGGSVLLSVLPSTSYHWNTGATGQSITASYNGYYTVTVTNSFNCAAIDSQLVTVVATPTPTIFANGPLTFCAGGSVSLDAGVWNNYLWSNGATTEVINLSTSGTFTVTVSDITGCTGTTSRVVTVNVNPTVTITPSGSTSFCQGGSVFLNVGTYTTYLWSNGNTTATVVASTGGTYTITISVASGCTATASQVVTVNPAPTPIITPNGPTSFCAGGTVNLNVNTYASYHWSTSATTQAIFNINTGGTYIVTVTDGNGCTGTTSQVVTVTALPTPTITPNGPTTFCSGGSVTLDAGTYASYHWMNNATTQTVTAVSSGTYIVTVTNAGGCTGTNSISVTVNPTPTPTITPSGPVVFCQGGSVNLTAGASASYAWSTGATTQSINNLNTNGTFTVTVTNGTGCTGTISQAVTVNALPTPVITASGPITFCIGDSVKLNAGVGYVTYLWSTGSTANTIKVTASGTYTVTVTNNNGCVGSTSQSITVNALPVATITPSGPTTFCSGNNVTLDAGIWGTYLWNTSANSRFINVNTSGTYTVTVSDNHGCYGTTTLNVTVNPLPTVTDTSTLANVCVTWTLFNLNGGIPAGGTYTGTGVTLNQFNPNLAGIGTHTITYTYTDGNGCTNFTTHNITVNACTDVPTVASGNFINVFPNPNDGNFTINFNVTTQLTGLRIVDVTGRIVYTQSMSGMEGTQNIDANSLSHGIYYWELIAADNVISKGKMIITK